MRIAANLETVPGFRERRAERSPTEIPAGMRERGRSGLDVEVVDLSTHGCRIEFCGELIVGSHAWLNLPDMESWFGKVVWMAEGVAGLDFETPLQRSVAERVIASSAVGEGQR